jgi:hypothetical protein
MSFQEILTLWSDSPATSVAIWFFIIVLTMYFGRKPAHQTILAVTRLLRNSLKLSAKSVALWERRVAARNQEVLVNFGKEQTETVIEREFHRVSATVAKDLSGYPAIQRKLSDAINRIEEDYRGSTETPPSPPAWLEAVESIAKIPRNGDPTVARILDDIQASIEKAHKETLDEYRKSSLRRHDLLKKMLPTWRSVDQNLTTVKQNVGGLEKRSKYIDEQVDKYKKLVAQETGAVRTLSSSAFTQFFISGLVLVIAILGGIINFQLIAMPMSEMVGGTSEIGPMRTADVAALVIIMVEIAMGLFLVESLRITHLFPVIGSMDDRMRKRMIWITLTFLAVLASVEASLAYMRDLLAADREALAQTLAGVQAIEAEFRWIPTIGQMVMGFVLPFTLAFVAIPLESFVTATRTVIGALICFSLRMTAYTLRALGNLMTSVSTILTGVYDMVIFLPLKLEEMALQQQRERKLKPKQIEKVEEEQPVVPLLKERVAGE